MKTYAVINQKGGVGKTTSVANLGAAVAARGYRVCLIDLDPQAHLTLHFGIEPNTSDKSIYDVLTDQTPLSQATQKTSTENVWVLPANIDLAAAEIELVNTVGREQILRDALAEGEKPFDFVLIDCPPSLGLLTLNALAAANDVLIPLQPHFLALQGLGKLLETVSLVQRRINPGLKVAGVLFCMYESNTKLASEVAADIHEFLNSSRQTNAPWSGAKLFDTCIRRNIKLAESPSYGKTIFGYEPQSNGAADYDALAEEFLAIAIPREITPVPTPPPSAEPEIAAEEFPHP